MGHIVKSLMKGVSALLLIAGLTLSYMPATEAEETALGPEAARLSLVQMRMAKISLAVAPDRTVRVMADALDIPEPYVRDALTALAEGRPLRPSESQIAEAPVPDTGRRIDAGGALFVTAPD